MIHLFIVSRRKFSLFLWENITSSFKVTCCTYNTEKYMHKEQSRSWTLILSNQNVQECSGFMTYWLSQYPLFSRGFMNPMWQGPPDKDHRRGIAAFLCNSWAMYVPHWRSLPQRNNFNLYIYWMSKQSFWCTRIKLGLSPWFFFPFIFKWRP